MKYFCYISPRDGSAKQISDEAAGVPVTEVTQANLIKTGDWSKVQTSPVSDTRNCQGENLT